MKLGFLTVAAVLLTAFAGDGALAQTVDVWDVERVQEIAKKLRAGESINEGHLYPSSTVQIIGFEVDDGVQYVIDARARLCYFKLRNSVTLVPCEAVKRGYPMLAPLIPWEK